MACGAPVIVSDAPALPEVVGDAARIVPARDVAAWAEALTVLLTDPVLRADLAARGPRRAACFSYETTARQTLAVYRKVAGK
jgi:glycosyltransferase involved in cell wall biosynthesis